MDGNLIKSFAENIPGAALRYVLRPDRTDAFEILNTEASRLFGLRHAVPPSGIVDVWAHVDERDQRCVRDGIAASARSMSQWDSSFHITDAQGCRKHCAARGSPRRLADGVVEWLIIVFDVTAQVLAERSQRSGWDEMQTLSEAIPDGFALFDSDERMVICNRHFREIYSLPEDDTVAIGWRYADLLSHAADHGHFLDAAGRRSAWIAERLEDFRSADRMIEERYARGRWFRILDRPTRDGGRVTFRIETTRTRNRHDTLERDALTDSVTGLYNRRGLSRHVIRNLAGLGKDERIALLHIDLDKFKTVNDAAGHEAGDAVLLAIARRLHDLAADRAVAARIGGDEFVVALPTAAPDDATLAWADTLREALVAPVPFGKRQFQVGASVGVAFWNPENGTSLEQSLLDADTALMKGKVHGRNRTVCFRAEMRAEAERTAQIAGDIKRDLYLGRFVPFFQPQMVLPGGEVAGLETLARWRTSDGQVLPAADFVAVAQETGLIGEIDRRMAAGALDLLQSFMAEGRQDVRVALNLSSMELRDPEVVDRLLDQLFARGVPANLVAIEILESTLLDDRSDVIASNIRALDKAGFRIELDDFGTGHTALASLQRFPVHRIKIDQSLIRHLDVHPPQHAIVKGIVALARSLRIEIIAEGVETSGELNALQDLGVSVFQGFAIAPPMDADAVRTWLMHCGSDPVAIA